MHCIICGAGGCVCGPAAPLRYPPLGSAWTLGANKETIVAAQNLNSPNMPEKTDGLAPVTSETEQANLPVFGTGAPAAQAGPVYVATERLYLDKDGMVVYEDDPARVSLLLGVGGKMPRREAQAYGLMPSDAELADKAAADKAAADKAAADLPAGTGEL